MVAILGPTASGKSSVALEVASSALGKDKKVELVSIDAMQVYRGMDVGTAKPTEHEQRSVRHHLIDMVDVGTSFTVAEFQGAFRRVLGDMERRGATPLLVGGTGLYLRAVVDDLDIPGTWPEIRSELEAEAERVGSSALYARLQEADPRAASKMEPTNTRRIVRALEVLEGSGRRFSSYGPGVDEYPPSRVRQVALRWPRDVLRERIRERVKHMFESGWEDEVRRLQLLGMSPTARQALGYREMADVVDGRIGLQEAFDAIVVRTCQFAARQERWFRRDPRVNWIDVHSDPVAEAAPRILELLA